MGLCYRIPLPGPFYYSGRVGSKHWLPRSSNTGTGPMGFVVKWFIVYPSVAVFGAGLAIMVVPFYGLLWVVRRSVFPCSAAFVAAFGSGPRFEAVGFRSGLAARSGSGVRLLS